MDSFSRPAATTIAFNLHYFKPATTTTHTLIPPPPFHRPSTFTTAQKKPSSSSFALDNHTPAFQSTPKFEHTKSFKPRPSWPHSFFPVHRRAASGYAAALIDTAQFDGALAALERDVRRLSKLLGSGEIRGLMGDASVGDREKGQVLKVILERGRFRGELRAVVNLLVDKGKLGIVWEALDEFERIYGELKFGMDKKTGGTWAERSPAG